jgi:hypothetical protein
MHPAISAVVNRMFYGDARLGSFEPATRFCRAFEELRQFERYRRTRAETGSLAEPGRR